MAVSPVVFHLVIRSTIVIDASASVVWQYLERPRDWKPSIVSLERLAGEPGQVGETLRLGQRPGDETVYVRMQTLQAEPAVRRVQTLTTEADSSIDGFVMYALTAVGNGTHLACDVVARCTLPNEALSGRSVSDFAQTVNEATAAKLDADHRALKALIEQWG